MELLKEGYNVEIVLFSKKTLKQILPRVKNTGGGDTEIRLI